MTNEEIIRDYLAQCAILCNFRGYSHLDLNREKIKQSLLEKHASNGNKPEVLRQLQVCETETISFIQEQRLRLFAWMDKYNEEELIERINTALQRA